MKRSRRRLRDARNTRKLVEKSGTSDTGSETSDRRAFAFPFFCVILTLLGIIFF